MRIGVLSDLHLSAPGTPDGHWINSQPLGRSADLLDQALGQFARIGVDAVLLLGDLADNGSPHELGMLRARLRGVTASKLAIAGNHDLTELDDPLEQADVESPGVPGQRLGPVRIAAGMLRRTGQNEFTDELPPLTWPEGQAVVWLSHFPVLPTRQILAGAGLKHAGDMSNREQVADTLGRHPGPVVVLAGHLHVHLTVSAANILQLDHPALVEWPHGLAILDIANTSRGLEVRWSVEHLASKSSGVSVNTMLAGADERWCWRADKWWRLEEGSQR